MKLTQQEDNITNYLATKQTAYWEELAQFAKDPSKVKLSTIQRAVSGIKKKFQEANMRCPFDTKLSQLNSNSSQQTALIKAIETEKIQFNGQELVKVIRNTVNAPQIDTRKQCQIDFVLNRYTKQITVKSGIYNLGDDDFVVFEHFHSHPEKIVSLEELRDEVVFPKYGSKMPPKWFFTIQRRINNIRRTIPELKNRILTIKLDGGRTGYLFQ